MPTNKDLLFSAVKENRVQDVRKILSDDLGIFADSCDYEALKEAINRGFTEIVNVLLEKGADIEGTGTDRDGPTPLLLAVQFNKIDILTLLIRRGAHVNAVDCYGHTSLILAQTPELITVLLNAGAKVDAVDNIKRTALYAHVISRPDSENKLQIIRLLLDAGANTEIAALSYFGDKEKTPLMDSMYSESAIAAELLKHGALVNAVKTDNKYSTLLLCVHLVATNPFHKTLVPFPCEKIKLLLDAGAEINAQSTDGDSALILASQSEQCFQIVKMLLSRGANKNLVNNAGDTALSIARKKGHHEIASLLETFGTFHYRLREIRFGEAKLDKEGLELYASVRDPITFEIMNDPIALSSGITYDRNSIIKWFESQKSPITHKIPEILPCPVTRLPIRRDELNNKTHVITKNMIEHFVRREELIFEGAVRTTESALSMGYRGMFAPLGVVALSTPDEGRCSGSNVHSGGFGARK